MIPCAWLFWMCFLPLFISHPCSTVLDPSSQIQIHFLEIQLGPVWKQDLDLDFHFKSEVFKICVIEIFFICNSYVWVIPETWGLPCNWDPFAHYVINNDNKFNHQFMFHMPFMTKKNIYLSDDNGSYKQKRAILM